jgi:hypothetical protein
MTGRKAGARREHPQRLSVGLGPGQTERGGAGAMRNLVMYAVVLLLFCGSPAPAQNPIELGFDAGVLVRMQEPRWTNIAVPLQHVRVGFYLSEVISLEPAFALRHSRVSGSSSTIFTADVGLLWHFSPPAAAPVVYLRPFAGVIGVFDRDNVFGIGLGAGLKGPLAERPLWRTEANVRHTFDPADIEDTTTIGRAHVRGVLPDALISARPSVPSAGQASGRTASRPAGACAVQLPLHAPLIAAASPGADPTRRGKRRCAAPRDPATRDRAGRGIGSALRGTARRRGGRRSGRS